MSARSLGTANNVQVLVDPLDVRQEVGTDMITLHPAAGRADPLKVFELARTTL